jgi:tetratricopeptide (TPR) repeat protein
MVEDITTALSRINWLFVIARNSSFTYKGKAVDIKQVGRELGVRYVLEGSVRKSRNRIRITGQLIDAISGAHLWADRFEGGLEDIFDLQDQVTMSVVGAVSPKLEQAEIERAKRKPTENLDAYDYYLRGTADLERASREANEKALKLFYKAIDLDPTYASPYAAAARCYTLRKANNWMIDPAGETVETARLARRAIELGRDDAVALSRAGYALARVVFEPREGAAFLERALILNPHLALAWQYSGLLKAFLGESEIAIERLARAMRLSPLDPGLYSMQTAMALAHFIGGDYDTALSWTDKASREDPNFLPTFRIAATSAGLAGRLEEAKRAIARMLQIDPTCRISNLREHVPLQRPQDLAKYAEGLRLAGLPE